MPTTVYADIAIYALKMIVVAAIILTALRHKET